LFAGLGSDKSIPVTAKLPPPILNAVSPVCVGVGATFHVNIYGPVLPGVVVKLATHAFASGNPGHVCICESTVIERIAEFALLVNNTLNTIKKSLMNFFIECDIYIAKRLVMLSILNFS
jgi:hypothetical protein